VKLGYDDHSSSIRLPRQERYNTISTVDVSSYAIAYDHMFYTSTDFTPFFGVSIGYFNYKISGLQSAFADFGLISDKDSVNFAGMSNGFTMGTTYSINNNFDLESGLKFMLLRADDTLIINEGTQTTQISSQLDNLFKIYFGANYKF